MARKHRQNEDGVGGPGGASLGKPVSRARAMLPQAELDEVIRGIMKDMCEGRWRTGPSHEALAKKYGVTIAGVQAWAAKASLVLRQLRGDVDHVREQILLGIDLCQDLALREDEMGRRDLKAALQALELRAKVFGVMAPKQVEVSHQPVEVDIDELRAILRPMGYDIVALARDTEGEPVLE